MDASTLWYPIEKARAAGGLVARRYPLPAKVDDVFATPWQACVATVELNNALTAIHLDGPDAPALQPVMRDYADIVNTGAHLYPRRAWPGVIAYAGRRRMHVIDVSPVTPDKPGDPKERARAYFLTGFLDENVRSFAALGPQRFLGLIAKPGKRREPLRLLTLDVTGGARRLLGERSIPPESLAHVSGPDIFVYDRQSVTPMNHQLQEVQHALPDVLMLLDEPAVLPRPVDWVDPRPPALREREQEQGLAGEGESEHARILEPIKELIVHPRAPLAIVVTVRSGGDAMWVVTWPDPLRPRAQAVTFAREIRWLEWSPEGDWLRFSSYTANAKAGPEDALFAMAVRLDRLFHPDHAPRDEDGHILPAMPLDPPRMLQFGERGPPRLRSLAWTNRPTGLVASTGKALHRWDLGAPPGLEASSDGDPKCPGQ
jgi:hypothetical protein